MNDLKKLVAKVGVTGVIAICLKLAIDIVILRWLFESLGIRWEWIGVAFVLRGWFGTHRES